ncbi:MULTISPECIES: hypothetical protein [Sphingobacterium]|uniref:hypothetical protein n=1 Tax=Sphingobacterium TaxID=28453 RepID=UPI00104A88C6|nr:MULTISPECIES: hypothetical protein [Sphingobacterium]MCW2261101.1 uncharacterized membrane protein HdeD (DUF308 family) [Sphingobacterium kitahiroshimense]TCR08263.1 hypothetical protein EDF67_10751 [Sphingobacterium sp. JUb78]
MKQEDLVKEIASIRNLMEKSSKFISISGISSVLIGTYALLGAAYAYYEVYGFDSQMGYRDHYVNEPLIIMKLLTTAILVLIASIFTGVFMAIKKAKANRQNIWNTTSRALFFAMAVPLCTGGLFAIIAIFKENYAVVSSILLIFYGLALTAGSHYTFSEIKGLGILEIVLGLLALLFPGNGIIFWALGFGVLHIIYGVIVHKKYE